MAPYANKYKAIVAKTASYTLKRDDEDKLFTNEGAGGAVTFTLPPIADVVDGWTVSFFVTTGQAVTVAAPSSKLVVFNSAASTSIAFSTASEIIGNGVTIVYSAASGKYIAMVMLGSETATPVFA